MSKYKWIIDRIKLNHGDLRQIGEEIIYYSRLGDYNFKLNIDINKLAEVAKEPILKKEYNNGVKRKDRNLKKYKTKN